jgi:hypothetical protein
MSDAANKPLRRTLRPAACATSARMLVSFGVTLDGLHYWFGTMGSGLLLAAHVHLPAAAFDFDGPAALRSDNAHVIFSYEAE